MLAPASDHVCEGCAFLADPVDAVRRHFEQADLTPQGRSEVGIMRWVRPQDEYDTALYAAASCRS